MRGYRNPDPDPAYLEYLHYRDIRAMGGPDANLGSSWDEFADELLRWWPAGEVPADNSGYSDGAHPR
jgi:hypothetical protein